MASEAPPKGIEPIGDAQPAEIPQRPRVIHPGIVMQVRGRSIRLRGLRKPPAGILYWLTVLGPGLIAGAVSNDSGSIATYSQAGAQYGYDLLWIVLLITVSLIVVQEMCARIGAATGRGLLSLVRSNFGIGPAFFSTLIVLTGGFIGSHSRGRLLDWRFSEFLRGDPEAARAGLDYHGLINRLPPGEIAYLADQLPYLYATELLALLPDTTAADAIEVMMPDLQVQVFEELPQDRALRLLTLMRPDVVAGLLSNLGMDQAKELLEKMPSLISDRVLHLLRYPRDTAAGIMTNDMVTLPQETSVADALQVLRNQLKRNDYINFIQMVFVVDSESQQKLQGALSLRDLLVADEGSRLEKVMNRYLITLEPLEPAKTAARRVIESALAALPVLGDGGTLIGIVPVDTALTITMPNRGEREVLRLFS